MLDVRRTGQIILKTLTALSLVLFIVAAAWWGRSYSTGDVFRRSTAGANQVAVRIESGRASWERFSDPFYRRDEATGWRHSSYAVSARPQAAWEGTIANYLGFTRGTYPLNDYVKANETSVPLWLIALPLWVCGWPASSRIRAGFPSAMAATGRTWRRVVPRDAWDCDLGGRVLLMVYVLLIAVVLGLPVLALLAILPGGLMFAAVATVGSYGTVGWMLGLQRACPERKRICET
jgi:hypothetical protein